MANDDPNKGTGDKAEAGAKPPRRTPPTLDLSAKDVTPVSDDAATAEPVPGAADAPEEPRPETVPADEVPVHDAAPPAGEPGADTPKAEEPPPPEARPARRLGIFGTLVVALVSGVLGGAFAVAVVSTFYGADANIDAITELEARALDLRQRVEALESQPAPAPGLAAPEELATRLDALESGLDALGKKVDALPAAAPGAAGDGTAASASEIAALAGRVGALEEKAAAPATASPDEVAAVRGQVEALAQRVAALPAPAPAASPADLDAANSRIKALEDKLSAATAAQRASGQGAAQLVLLGSLREAVASGRPFATELKAARTLLGEEGAPLAALEPAAADGFATGPALAARLRAATVASTESTSAGASADSGVVDRFLNSARNLVTVRRSEDAAASPDLAKAEAALMRGDADAAKAAIEALPPSERTAAQPVLAAIEARQAALATIADLDRRVLATLAGGAQ